MGIFTKNLSSGRLNSNERLRLKKGRFQIVAAVNDIGLTVDV